MYFCVTLLPLRAPVSCRWGPSTLHISTEPFMVGQLGTKTFCTKCAFQMWTPILHYFFLGEAAQALAGSTEMFRGQSQTLQVWLNRSCTLWFVALLGNKSSSKNVCRKKLQILLVQQWTDDTHTERLTKECTSASQNLTEREIWCCVWLYVGEMSITVMSQPTPKRNTVKIKWCEHKLWISFRKPSSYRRHLYVMLWFHHLLSGGHWFLSLSLELPHIFQEKEGKRFRLELLLGCEWERKQRHQSWITGRNLSWHHSASTLPQEQNRIKTHPICASPLPKCMLI